MTYQFLRAGEIIRGTIQENGSLKTPLRSNIRNVRLVGLITERIDSENQSLPLSFTFLNLEDGSGSVQVRAFGEKKRQMVEAIKIGDAIMVKGEIGKQEERFYVRPKIARKLSFVDELYNRSRTILSYFLRSI
ncbi:MAG: hypothetical protein GWO20_02015 [Candidatus Korarchaeota archaeon]|nr:hypothetical protein [Candidatus Korarchaeota archaeon]NIU84610.1 hypothetical protein [Candidatus Thorarchaeota archaeon]NIW12752.1 hypothetical protein [Candidatus Thorarchaeota archaeon]NIW50960.1 hypothetical protein [Candidatus Korarchaeota archaeon]